jgi:phage antirepressor YoqD-like protein
MSRVPLLFSTRDAATFLGVGRTKLLELLRERRVRAKDLDGRLKFTAESLIAFRDRLPDALEAERQAPRA